MTPSVYSTKPSFHSSLPTQPSSALQVGKAKLNEVHFITNDEDSASAGSDDDDFPVNTISEQVANMKLNPNYPRYVGESSGARLIYDAFLTKHETLHNASMVERAKRLMKRRPQFWNMSPVRILITVPPTIWINSPNHQSVGNSRRQ